MQPAWANLSVWSAPPLHLRGHGGATPVQARFGKNAVLTNPANRMQSLPASRRAARDPLLGLTLEMFVKYTGN